MGLPTPIRAIIPIGESFAVLGLIWNEACEGQAGDRDDCELTQCHDARDPAAVTVHITQNATKLTMAYTMPIFASSSISLSFNIQFWRSYAVDHAEQGDGAMVHLGDAVFAPVIHSLAADVEMILDLGPPEAVDQGGVGVFCVHAQRVCRKNICVKR